MRGRKKAGMRENEKKKREGERVWERKTKKDRKRRKSGWLREGYTYTEKLPIYAYTYVHICEEEKVEREREKKIEDYKKRKNVSNTWRACYI